MKSAWVSGVSYMADEVLEIECKFRPMEKYEVIFGERGVRKRLGSYHGSYFWDVKGFGCQKWAVSAIIEGDFTEHKELESESLAAACVGFLNRPVGKRKKKQPYGNLEVYKHALQEDGSLHVILITDQKKNKNFWGKGQTVPGRVRLNKKGR